MDKSDYGTLILLVACGYAAYRLVQWLWPIFEQRKNLTAFEMVERAMDAPIEERQRQAAKYGSIQKTIIIHLVNTVLLLAWVNFGAASKLVFWSVFVYLCVGFVVAGAMRLPTAPDLAGHKLNDRLWLRIFHAWLWPVYLLYVLGQK